MPAFLALFYTGPLFEKNLLNTIAKFGVFCGSAIT